MRPRAGFASGWPVAYDPKAGTANLAHCYGSVGVGRGLSPDTGTGGELYAVIGHAPRHLDRNIAVVGRVVEGIEHLSSLPRGTEALGFYKERQQDVPIASVRLAADIAAGRAAARSNIMDTDSATLRRLSAGPRQPQGRFLHPPGRRRRPVQRAGAGAANAVADERG